MRTSPPSAFASKQAPRGARHAQHVAEGAEDRRPGARRSPRRLSISSSGVTHTGQPGPCTSVISGGSRSCKPNLTMVCVCPPQTSMIVHGRVIVRRMACASMVGRLPVAVFVDELHGPHLPRASSSSLHLAEVLEDLLRLVLVHHAQREADVHQHVVAHRGLGREGQADLFPDAARNRPSRAAASGRVLFEDAQRSFLERPDT